MADFLMPQLGADMAAGTLSEWLKKPGDSVHRGDIVAVVETDKGAIEIEVFQDGVIDSLLVEPGAKVPVGTVLATINGGGADASREPPKAAPPATQPVAPAPVAPAPAARTVARPAGDRVRISPAAARLAAERHVDIRALTGTGPQGAIRIADVEAAAAGAAPVSTPTTPAAAAEAEPETPAMAMRRAIAAAMERANRDIPHYFLSTAIDMTRALAWLAEANKNRPVTGRLLYGVLLIKAVARALEDFPELNGFWRDGRLQPADGIHVGWAVSLRGGGLVAPAIHDAGQMDFDPLMDALRDVVKRARAFRLRGSELSDPTVTVTSLGEQGVESVYGVIYPPQVALVGFGKIVQRPWVVEDTVQPRSIVQASLAADHRASDGHRGGLFLSTVDRLLQEPETL